MTFPSRLHWSQSSTTTLSAERKTSLAASMIDTLARNEPGRSQAAGSQGRSATVAVTTTSPARTAVSASAAMRTSTLG